MKQIVLAGGCFWGVEAYFKRIKGIIQTKVGYTDGTTINPSYQEVCTGRTYHVEACELIYDEQVISLEKILKHLFSIIDPTILNRQGNDVGTQYRTGIYYEDESDAQVIRDFIQKEQANYEQMIVVEVKKQTTFYDAEEFHQDYLTKNPMGYCHVNLYRIPKEDLKDEYR
ncbi:peptide-methionine (S)-S-oxide reductase MsrA [Turicibacter sp. TJ11]|uniref:peptide-methionine (S)-S-oxide reductase MsrA n=1 Tax=Turicibacter sp. TJ11 TaxID=2806443 RepID=UPI001F2B263F|nr:peptide-methionine (S)-S-oxide reductase MsrA [Turicibacter sp. TJ11]